MLSPSALWGFSAADLNDEAALPGKRGRWGVHWLQPALSQGWHWITQVVHPWLPLGLHPNLYLLHKAVWVSNKVILNTILIRVRNNYNKRHCAVIRTHKLYRIIWLQLMPKVIAGRETWHACEQPAFVGSILLLKSDLFPFILYFYIFYTFAWPFTCII